MPSPKVHRFVDWYRYYNRALERDWPSEYDGNGRPVWDVTRGCLKPVYREMHGAIAPDAYAFGDLRRGPPVKTPRHILEVYVPCRKCSVCLRHRSRLWAARARAEIEASDRTWFGTLTMRPEEHVRTLSLARRNLDRQGIDLDTLGPGEVFTERCKVVSRELTLYLKRVREEEETRFRYCLVAEQHKSGLPHWHALIHETPGLPPIRKTVLETQWPHGFTKWKLCDKGAAGYVAKYLSKDALSRVRASLRYGSTEPIRPKS